MQTTDNKSVNTGEQKEVLKLKPGIGVMEVKCMHCGKSYYISASPMAICTTPCPRCGIDSLIPFS